MKNKLINLLGLACLCVSLNLAAQQPDPEKLPEYIVITAENTKLLGGIGITIDWKKSPYKKQFEELEDYLVSKDQKRVRTLSDLFNAMYELGYRFDDAFNANSGSLGLGTDVGDVSLSGSDAKFRTNLVFQKM